MLQNQPVGRAKSVLMTTLHRTYHCLIINQSSFVWTPAPDPLTPLLFPPKTTDCKMVHELCSLLSFDLIQSVLRKAANVSQNSKGHSNAQA